MTSTTLIRRGDDEFVKLPPELKFGRDVELTVERSGDGIRLYPKQDEKDLSAFREMLDQLDRIPKPSAVEVRDVEEIPERPHLFR